jgi:hypothetical protein
MKEAAGLISHYTADAMSIGVPMRGDADFSTFQ